jgi:two-component system cell cycle sensor histidine kinase/response regulator CckA
VWHGRLVDRKKDATLYTADASISPIRDESGRIVNYVAIQRDVTRELQLEAQYLQAQKLGAVGRLTAGIAHDFNNLLTAVNGFAELLLVQLPPGQPAWDFAEKIYDAGRHAADLVAQLLAFSRQQALERQVLDLNGVVTGMGAMLRRIIGEDVELKTVLSPDLWPVLADRSQVEQIVANLAVNARDAMPGGGRLTLETRNVAGGAVPPDLQTGEYVLLAVEDTGVGMSDEVKAHLFEPFFTTKGLGKGTGLGLATVHGIVEQSGGQVRVDSQSGQGAVFRIYLPRFRAPVGPEAEPAVEVADLPGGEETILLVEDDERVRDLTQRMLEERGYRVLEACDGAEALSVAAAYSGRIHLLLTDLVLPGMSGGVLAERLGQERSGLRVLFMSGYAGEDVLRRYGVGQPGTALLRKPFGAAVLLQQVRQVLDDGS